MRAVAEVRREHLRALATRVGALVVAFATFIAVLRGGCRYFFCPMMNEVFDAPCCGGHADADGDHDVASIHAAECCQAKRLGTLPSSAVSTVPDVAPSPCVAVLPSMVDASGGRMRARLVRFAQPARAGPRTAKRRRADLMVWHS